MNAALRNHSNAIKIRHTVNAKQRLEQAHQLMGISNNLSAEMEAIFSRWTKLSITDQQVRKLIQSALVSNREVLAKIQQGNEEECSTYYKNMCESAFEYTIANQTQQLDTTKGTVFGAYNGITGYFQNVRKYKDETSKLKSLMYGGLGQQRGQVAFNLCQDFANGQSILSN